MSASLWLFSSKARSLLLLVFPKAIENYEFTLTPRALLAPDGTSLACLDKSKLIHSLEKLTTEDKHKPHEDQPPHAGSSIHYDATDSGFTDPMSDQPSRKIALVDGMVLVQKLNKNTVIVVTVRDLCWLLQ